MEHAVLQFLIPLLGRSFFWIGRRWPIVCAGLTLLGDLTGVLIVVEYSQSGEWVGVGIGGLVTAFFTALFATVVYKIRAGTWTAFCDWGITVFEKMGESESSRKQSRPVTIPLPVQTTVRSRRFVLHCPNGCQPRLSAVVEQLLRQGLVFVVVVGKDCHEVHAAIEALAATKEVNRSKNLYVTSLPGETVEAALAFARSFDGEHREDVAVLEL